MSHQQHSQSQYSHQRQSLASQISPNNNTVASVGQSSQEAMAQLASQVQASIGVNPFCGSALPLQNSIASRYAPIQPAVATRRLVPVGGLDASQYWNNASQPAFSSASYEIPSNWTGGLSQGANANSATVSNARTMKKNSGSRTNSKSTASAIAVPLMTTSSIVPPDHFLDLEHTNEGERVPRRQSFSDSISTDAESVKPKTSATAKAKQNRERNREHARSTRLRKKAYVQKLKEMADGLRAIQTDEIRQRRLAVHQMTEMQKTRKRLIQKFLEYHASYEEDPQAWASLVEDNFWLKQPVTPFRSFRRSEVERDYRVIRGIDAIICDAASVSIMIERTGSRNARWQRIKGRHFERSIEQSQILVGSYQRVESSLSSSSGTDSSDESLAQRNHHISQDEPKATVPIGIAASKKVSSSSGESGIGRKRKFNGADVNSDDSMEGNGSTWSETEGHARKNLLPRNIARSGGIIHTVLPSLKSVHLRKELPQHQTEGDMSASPPPMPIRLAPLRSLLLKERDIEEIGAYYSINEDDMIMIEDVLMCPFVFRTKNAVLCGSLSDCVMPGMIRANFSKGNKLQSIEMVYDAMGLMQQLDGANGGQVTAQVIPGSLEMALMSSPDEARVITEAHPPFSVAHVNEAWTKLTKYTQVEVEGRGLLELLEGERTDPSAKIRPGKPKHTLEEVSRGKSACSTNLHYDKLGNIFVDFMCSYPLTNSSNEISHLLHVNLGLRTEHAFIS